MSSSGTWQTTAEELGPLQHHGADQQPAVAAALMPRCAGERDAAGDQVLGDGDEVVVAALLVRAFSAAWCQPGRTRRRRGCWRARRRRRGGPLARPITPE
jgi:hypothetical protein